MVWWKALRTILKDVLGKQLNLPIDIVVKTVAPKFPLKLAVLSESYARAIGYCESWNKINSKILYIPTLYLGKKILSHIKWGIGGRCNNC